MGRFRRVDYPDGSWRVIDTRPRGIGASGSPTARGTHTSSAAGRPSTPPGPRNLRWPEDDGVFAEYRPWPFEMEAHAGLDWRTGVVVFGLVLVAVGGLLWWLG